jgi:hypothetical protein
MTTTPTSATVPMVRHRFARMDTIAIIPTPARRTVIGDLITSWTAYSSELARGTDGAMVADSTAGVITVGDTRDAVDTDAALMADADSRVVALMDGLDLRIEVAPDEASRAGIAAADFTAAATSTAAEADSTVVGEAEPTVAEADLTAAADMVAAIAN